MSRIELKRWAALGLAAFALRASAALLTEFHPVFPAYSYQDAVFAERLGRDLSDTWTLGHVQPLPYSASQRAHAALIAVFFYLLGAGPLFVKLFNAGLGAGAVVCLGLAFRAALPERAALLAAGLCAAWPSHVFYTSQNFKEAPTFFLLLGALALLVPMLASEKPAPSRAAAALVLFVLAGTLRGYVVSVAALALLAGALLALRRPSSRAAAALVAVIALAAPGAHRAFTTSVVDRLLPVTPGVPATLPPLVTAPAPAEGPRPAPWTPAGISDRRYTHQASDRSYAQNSLHHEIATQIRPDARFDSWLDIALFIPPTAFTVLFQPLPLLYPMDGKLGRIFSAAENVFLLFLAAAAFSGLARRRDWSPSIVVLLVFFTVMTAGSALMEFDLGSAGRHKLLYLPMLFPFAAEEILRRAGRSIM